MELDPGTGAENATGVWYGFGSGGVRVRVGAGAKAGTRARLGLEPGL